MISNFTDCFENMMHHSELSDLEFEQQFANHEIDPSTFNHEAHVRLAWIHIRNYGVQIAAKNITRQLKSFVEFLGVPEKYNETLTIAAVKAVHHFRQKSEADSFSDFIAQNPRLKYHFKALISQHYRVDVFNSPLAKEKFLAPDLLPFD